MHRDDRLPLTGRDVWSLPHGVHAPMAIPSRHHLRYAEASSLDRPMAVLTLVLWGFGLWGWLVVLT